MGQGIDLARADAPEHAQAIDDFKDQLLLVLLRRLGGNVRISVSECDDTGGLVAHMSVKDGVFHFVVKPKQ